MSENLNDVIGQVKAGNLRAFESIVSRYKDKMYHLAYRMTFDKEDALELSQEIFLRIYRKISYFRDGTDFSAWCYKVASNVCLNWRRRNKMKTLSLDELSFGENEHHFELADERYGPPEAIDRQSARQEISRLMARLPAQYRLVINLRYLEDMPCEKIAGLTNIPLGTVKNYLFRARELMKKKIGTKL
jgi:RNA polymerase sigma-70 factor, ECF subfamily